MNRACSVETTEEVRLALTRFHITAAANARYDIQEHIPEAWRSQALGKLTPAEQSAVSLRRLSASAGANLASLVLHRRLQAERTATSAIVTSVCWKMSWIRVSERCERGGQTR